MTNNQVFPTTRPLVRRGLALSVAAAALLTAAACGGKSAAASSTTSTPAATTASASTSGSSGGGVAAAEAAVTADMAVPSTIGITTPLTSKPPTGKTVVFLQCAESQCGLEAKGIEAAATALGWKTKVLNFNETEPSTLVSAFNQALQYKPVAVMFPGVPEPLWQSVLPAYQAAGVKIVPSAPGIFTASSTVPAATLGNDWQVKVASAAADEVVANSNGAAKVLTLSVPSYPVFLSNVKAFESTLAANCPGCTNTEVQATIPELLAGQIPSLLVSALKRNSGVTYIYAVDGAFLGGFQSALQTAGLAGKYKIVSTNGNSEDMQDIANGTELATTGTAYIEGGWAAVDIALRSIQGMPIPAGDTGQEPGPLLVKSNVPAPTDTYDVPTDYAAEYEALWHITG